MVLFFVAHHELTLVWVAGEMAEEVDEVVKAGRTAGEELGGEG